MAQSATSQIPTQSAGTMQKNLSDDRTPDDYSFGKPRIGVYGGVKLSLR
jgi:hypothetical protein